MAKRESIDTSIKALHKRAAFIHGIRERSRGGGILGAFADVLEQELEERGGVVK